MHPCPCGSSLTLDQCCGPIHAGERPAATALELMRSRYSAYALANIEYLTQSLHPKARHDHDPVAAERWARNSKWLGLEVLSQEAGAEGDSEGQLEFIAHYRDQRGPHKHHEIARFVKEEGLWYYLEGQTPKVSQATRTEPKVGRNDPCHCGSGKKFKKCCGK